MESPSQKGPAKHVPRDREQTRANILKAVGRLLARDGFREMGINAIARESGVDKKLIYRYFGGLPELLKAFAEESDYWPDLLELDRETAQSGDAPSQLQRAKEIVLGFGRALRKRPLTQEIMRWELLERNELTDALARHREEQAELLFQSLREPAGSDMRAIGSLLAAGQTYLILRAKTVDAFSGLDLNSEQDWERIERAIGFVVEACGKLAESNAHAALANKL